MSTENFVDYVASPEETSLDAMRYALTQRNAAPNQQQSPLDGVTSTFKRLATEFNPLMIGRTLQDVPRVGYNVLIAPVASAWAEALRNVQAAGAAKAYGALGMPTEAAAAQSRVQPVTLQSMQAPLRSEMGQQTQQAIGEAFNALRLPPMGPGSGMPGSGSVSPRPFVTPNDVRVMGARATYAAREAGQIPTDIANVRGAGVQRLSPLTGRPSVGSRIGTAIEGTAQAAERAGDAVRDVGQSTADYIRRRQDMGLGPVPGLPPEFFPDLKMYAVRPKDSTLVTPTVPPTRDMSDLPFGTAMQGAIVAAGADKPALRPSDAEAYLRAMDLDIQGTNAPDYLPPPVVQERQRAFNAFVQEKAQGMYPDAPSPAEAVAAFNDRFSRQSDKDVAHTQLYDEFRDSPEGQAVGMSSLPSSTELQERHAAASQWLNSTLSNYVKRKLGAEGDPLVQQASQGFTMLPAEDVRGLAAEGVNDDTLRNLRAKAGMPAEGTVAPAIRDKSVELANAEFALQQLEQKREQYRDLAMQQGLPDPAMLPEYAATTNPRNAAIAQRDKLQEELSNLQLGRDYEKISDMAVGVGKQQDLLGRLDYTHRQFYPSITRARADEQLYYTATDRRFNNTGLPELAAQFYDDVIRGNIPIDKLKGMTVEKYVRGKAEGRVAEEKRQANAAAQLKTNIETRMKQDMTQYVKPENYFGNVGVLELSTTTGFSPDQIRKLISDDTLVLDHCVAEGPSPGAKATNPWTGRKRTYMPLVDPMTGQLRPGSSRTQTQYIKEASNPDTSFASMLSSVRDKATGLPVATIELKRLANGMYAIGYASGYQNGDVKKEYRGAIKDYLNSRANMIQSGGNNLSHVGLMDLHRGDDAVREARRILNVDGREATALLNDAIDNGQLPRFGSAADLRQALTNSQPAPAAQQPAAARPFTTNDLTDWLGDLRVTGLANDITRILSSARRDFPTNEPGYAGVLRDHPVAFAERLVTDADRLGNSELANALRDLANRIAQPAAQQPAAQQPAAQQPAARQPAARQPNTQQPVTVTALNDFVAFMRREVGVDAADTISHILQEARQSFPGAPDYMALLSEQPTAFAERIAELAQEQGNALVAQFGTAFADRIAPPVPPAAQPAARPLAQPEAQQPAVQGQGEGAPLVPRMRLAIDNAFELVERTVEGDPVATESIVGLERILRNRHLQPNATIGDLRILRTQLLSEIEFFAGPGRNAPAADALRNDLLPVVDALLAPQQIAYPGAGVAQQPAAQQFDPVLYDDAVENYHNALIELADEEGNWGVAIAEVDRVLDDLAHGADSIYGLWEGDEPLTDRTREYLATRFRELRQEYEIYAADAAREEGLGDWEPDDDHPANNPPAPANNPPAPANNLIAPLVRIPADIRAMDTAELAENGMTAAQFSEVQGLHDQIAYNNNNAELANIVGLVRNHVIGGWDTFSPAQREYLARVLQNTADTRNEQQQPPLAPYDDALMNFDAGLTDIAVDIGWPQAIAEIDRVIDELESGEDYIYGLWEDEGVLGARERAYLINRLRELREEYEISLRNAAQGDWEPDDNNFKAGGAVRKSAYDSTFALKYANGGTVSQPLNLDAMRYELMMRSK